ncbi:MAG: DUF2085 domain-containing protein [Ruminococcus sp.]|nr:DUF2085 domain-containing protein [Ruminococcus sp.]
MMDPKIKLWIKLMNIGSRVWGCHQIPERSFFFRGWQFPICSRCTGIIIGESLGFTRIKRPNAAKVCIVLMIPLIIDGLIQFKTEYESNNQKRFVTGLLFGYGFINLLISLILQIINTLRNEEGKGVD